MPFSIAIGSIQVIPESATVLQRECTCNEAQKNCMPSFVFSVKGQVNFRVALDHMLTCRSRQCASLRKKVREAMYSKLRWLFEEEVLLGCIQLQPFLYKEKRVMNVKKPQYYSVVAYHLAHCPHESCAKLRRAFLLKIRDAVSPSANQNRNPA